MVSKKIEVFSRKCIKNFQHIIYSSSTYAYYNMLQTTKTSTWPIVSTDLTLPSCLCQIVHSYMAISLDECNMCDSSDHSNKSMRRFVCIHKGYRPNPELPDSNFDKVFLKNTCRFTKPQDFQAKLKGWMSGIQDNCMALILI